MEFFTVTTPGNSITELCRISEQRRSQDTREPKTILEALEGGFTIAAGPTYWELPKTQLGDKLSHYKWHLIRK